jgi:glycosyltransferase involved in cell wall biosynthesis
MMKTVDISILFLTFNRSDLLSTTVDSIRPALGQSGIAFETIIADDCSTPEHQEVMRQIPVTHIVSQSVNGGLAVNSNAGIRACVGDLIMQIQDDWQFLGTPHFFRTCVEIFERYPDVGMKPWK